MSFLFNNEEKYSYSILEYIWFDSNGVFRSKTRVLYETNISSIKQIPKWNYDGSSTNQLGNNQLDNNTEIILVPCAFYKCPFRRNVGTSENTPYQENGILTNRLFEQLTFRRIDEIPKIGFVGLFVHQCFNQANM